MRRHVTISTALFCATVAYGQATVTDTISGKVHNLSNVEVTASRDSKTLTSSAPTHSLDSERMKVTGVTDISDALHRLPGVNLRDYGGAGGLKTVSVRGFGASHTAVIYDGITLSDCQSGQIDVSRYSLDNIGNMTMIVGDNDDIFIPARAAASAASLSIVSRGLPGGDSDKPTLTVQLRAGSFGYINPYLLFGTNVGEKVSVSATGEFIHTKNDYPFTLVNGTTTTHERRNNSRMNSGHAEANVRWYPTLRSSLTTKVYYYDNSRRLPGPVIYYNDVNKERLRESNVFAQTQYRNIISSKWSVQANAKFNWSSSLYHDENGKYPGGILNQNYWQREAYASGALLFMPGNRWAFDYSADYAFNNLNSNLTDDLRPYRNSILQSLTARYKTGQLTVMGRVLHSLYLNDTKDGDDSSAKDARRLSPSLSMSVRPVASQSLYFRISYKNIFRVPSFNESYFDHYGSKDLKPEITDQINLGITYSSPAISWMPDLTITADGYINKVKDKIVAIPYNMFIWNMVNLGKVRVYGLDLTLNATFSIANRQSIIVASNYSYQRAQPRTDPTSSEWMKQVAYTPLNSGSASVSYENPWINISIHATGVSTRYTTNNNLPSTRIDGYIEAGATAYRTFNLRGHSFEARADLINMFDKQYEIVARYPMPGRSWQITLRYNL